MNKIQEILLQIAKVFWGSDFLQMQITVARQFVSFTRFTLWRQQM